MLNSPSFHAQTQKNIYIFYLYINSYFAIAKIPWNKPKSSQHLAQSCLPDRRGKKVKKEGFYVEKGKRKQTTSPSQAMENTAIWLSLFPNQTHRFAPHLYIHTIITTEKVKYCCHKPEQKEQTCRLLKGASPGKDFGICTAVALPIHSQG